MRRWNDLGWAALLALATWGAPEVATAAAESEQPRRVRFNRDVRPILAENCFACHGFDPKHREAGLRLDTFAGATADREGSRGIIPGDWLASPVWQRIVSADPETRMPPPRSHKSALSPAQRETLERWIAEGAEYEQHWSFVPPERPPQPQILSTRPEIAEAAHPIDAFIQDKLTHVGLTPADSADAATLLRRVSLDLTGLPPSVAEVADFEQAASLDPVAAYSSAVDRLLASPHYGERWGRWWLDQARYADSNGYSIDAPRQIWKYRDWVIAALNRDLPFDQFTVEQLAGDLLPEASEAQRIATGFHRNTQINEEGGIDKEQFRIDSVFDRVATTGTVWLGLTIGCAQCHDHKFDPIEQLEFYRLFAFFNSQDEPTLKVSDSGFDVQAVTAEFNSVEGRIREYIAENASKLREWEAGLTPEITKVYGADFRKALEVPQESRSLSQKILLVESSIGRVGAIREWIDRYRELEKRLKDGVTTLVLQERATPRKTQVLIKGDFTRPADEVTPGTPSVLHPLTSADPQLNRLHFARWLVEPGNPLTARVIVNRVWQQYFGRGLVATENDFGSQGSPPSHPELLDWLATEFLREGWSLKRLHRLIVLSHTYRQSSVETPALREADPNNVWLARQSRLRLDAEIVRDVALTAAGLLSRKQGGPPVYPPIPDGVMSQGQVKRVWAASQGADRYRRGVYTFFYRATPPPSLTVFDAPDGYSACTRRLRSNTPLQALTLMNDASFFEFAEALAGLIEAEGLELAFRRCVARVPSAAELAVLSPLAPLTQARVLLNLDETLTRE